MTINNEFDIYERNASVFDLEYAIQLKSIYPKIWNKSGGTYGDQAFDSLVKIMSQGGVALTPEQVQMLDLRDAWISRHAKDLSTTGVVAQVKWLAVGNLGSAHSWSYGNANMLGFVSPDARKIKDNDLKKVTDDGKKIKDAIRGFDTEFPGEEAFNMEPKDYVDALLERLDGSIPKDSPLWNSQIGQIYSQLLEAYSNAGTDSGKKLEIWTAMQYFHKMFSHDYKYFAPMLGYDAVDAGSGVTLVHNRAAVVTVDKAFTISEGRQAFQSAKAAK